MTPVVIFVFYFKLAYELNKFLLIFMFVLLLRLGGGTAKTWTLNLTVLLTDKAVMT